MSKTSTYTGVRAKRMRFSYLIKWEAYGVYCGTKWSTTCDTEKEAAIAFDKFRISRGLKPINVLKPV